MRVQLKPAPEQSSLLIETVRQFTTAFNAVCAYGYEHAEKNGVTLHHRLYREWRERLPDLPSNLLIQARVKATEAVKSALTLARNGKVVSAPQSASCPPRYNERTYRVNWRSGMISLSTVKGRIVIPFAMPLYAEKYRNAKTCTADLIYRDGSWWLHIVVDIPAPEVEPTDTVIGVDLGIVQPAVTSNARFLGEKRWRDVEARRFRLRRALQKSGSKSAKRHLRKMGRKQQRFRRDCDHVLSKQIVAVTPPGATIAVENLTNIRARIKTRKGKQARRMHGWSFDQCRQFITYKAEERGCIVVGVDPRHTSQACSRCGYTARNNRRSRGFFQCRQCGYSLAADLNGARNIAAKLVSVGKSGVDGPCVKRPIVGGESTRLPAAHKPPALARGA
jgi:IS605 OrfB family transposase